MEKWMVDIIETAFARCFGLKEALTTIPKDAIQALSEQTCIRAEFLMRHIEEIKNL